MNAIQQLLTDHIDIWTAADTAKKSGRGRSSGNASNVYGIKKLRELILELAVRGKLVPQDSKDEPASELLKRIQAEKAKLIAEGKIKSPRPPLLQRGELTLPPTAASTSAPPFAKGGLGGISDEEQPFELPQGWEWARLGNLYGFEYGDNLPADKRSSTGEYPVYGSNGVVGSHNVCFINSPCIVIGRKGSAGALNLSLEKGCCVTDVAYYCIPPKSLDLIFSFKLFHTLGLDSLGKGIKPGLNRNEAYELSIAIPPLVEQHRIVAKVDELMALCDQLETQHSNAAEAHEKLVSHLLGTLTQSQSAEDFSANWQRIAAYFDTLFTTEASIDALKQTLLQLAVMGKLVPQDANDEPASELLKRIQAEKAKLIAEGKIKKTKPLPTITDEEKPFGVPESWKWARLGDVSELKGGMAYQSHAFSDTGKNQVIRMGNVRPWRLRLDEKSVFIDDSLACATIEYSLNIDDIVVTMTGTIGKRDYMYSARVYESDVLQKRLFLNQRLCSVRPHFVWPSYLDMAMKDDRLLDVIFANATGTANQANISMSSLNLWLIPTPPINEQLRIVAKVDELMAICDQLKARITKANQLQQKLADVVVEQAIS